MKTHLYRHFDADGRLLYVGISLSTVSRLGQHHANAHWYDKIAQVTVETFPDRTAAAYAEREAIFKEGPLYNIAGAGADPLAWAVAPRERVRQVTPALTAKQLLNIRPKPGRQTTVIYDGTVGGLAIRYGARGKIEFTLAYRARGDRHQYRQKLGNYPKMSLDEARAAAAGIKELAAAGAVTER